MDKKPEKLYSLPEVADFLGLSLLTVKRWSYQRRFPVVKLGSRTMVRESEIVKLQDRCDIPAKSDDQIGGQDEQ